MWLSVGAAIAHTKDTGTVAASIRRTRLKILLRIKGKNFHSVSDYVRSVFVPGGFNPAHSATF
jgi:hypothetical protein